MGRQELRQLLGAQGEGEGRLPQARAFPSKQPNVGPSSLATAQNTSKGHLKGFTVDCPSELTVTKQIGVEGLGLLPKQVSRWRDCPCVVG